MTYAIRPGAAGGGQGGREESGLAHRIGMTFLLAFLFLSYSRLTDAWVRDIVGFSADGLWIVFIVSMVALASAIWTGGARDALGGLMGRLLVGFTCWLLVATPFSFWRGGSLDMLQHQWSKSFFVFIIVAGLLRTRSETRRAMVTIGHAVVLAAFVCLLFGVRYDGGRLALTQGTLSNPNEVAQLLLIGLPFCWIPMAPGRETKVSRSLSMASMLLIIGAVLVTGSRSGLVAMASLLLCVFLAVPFARKAKILLGAVVLAALGAAVLPDDVWLRYKTIWQSRVDVPYGQGQSAFDSADERREILKQSLRLTLTHPVVGVGPGVFQAAAVVDSNERGQRAAWRETHNTYTQISSEAGIPALVLYLAALGSCLRRTYKAWRMSGGGREPEAVIPLCLFLSLVGFAMTAVFSSVAYQFYFPTLAGLTAALTNDKTARAVPGPLDAKISPAPPTLRLSTPGAATPTGLRPPPARMPGTAVRYHRRTGDP